jgi:hypothetical protein
MKEKSAMKARDAVVWVDFDAKQVLVQPHCYGVPNDESRWGDPIGAAYSQWEELTNAERVNLMLHTAIDLAMAGIALEEILVAFATVDEFRALGRRSYPMCRALTGALVGERLEQDRLTFDELLEEYGPEKKPRPMMRGKFDTRGCARL